MWREHLRNSALVALRSSLSSTTNGIAFEQVNTVFKLATLGPSAAVVFAICIASFLGLLGYVDGGAAARWASSICLLGTVHVIFARFYRRIKPDIHQWQPWARVLIILSLLEGIAWGWAPFALHSPHQEVTFAILLCTVGLEIGGILTTGLYLPAFFAFFSPIVLGNAWVCKLSDSQLLRAFFGLELFLLIMVGGLMLNTDRYFQQLMRLRLKTEDLAADLLRQKNSAEKANADKSTFLASASHDLRQPLHAIGLLSEMLQGTEISEQSRSLLKQVDESVATMRDMFSSLLDISRLEAGVIVVKPHRFALGPLLAHVCLQHADTALQRKLRLRHVKSSAYAYSDPVLVERILNNLVSNALRYTQQGRVVVGCRRRDQMLVIQVLDTGVGIAPEVQEKIFDAYFQVGNAERDRAKGFGLGLTIARQLALLLGSPLQVHSTLGHGSCFSFRVPLAAACDNTGEQEVDKSSIVGSHKHRQALVLVLDDDPIIRATTSSILRGWGLDVCAAEDDDIALNLLGMQTRKLAFIIADFRLRDGKTGIAATQRIRRLWGADIPAILVTGDTAPVRLAQAQSSGMTILHKPVLAADLRSAVDALLGC